LIEEDLFKGIGVSLVKVSDDFIELIKKYKNAVIHIINGVVDLVELKKLYDNNLKILILGYKQFRKGKEYYSQNVEDNKKKIYDALSEILQSFKVVSFDNLAIEQLQVKRLLSQAEWDEFYMGDDGNFTFYVDLVDRKFAKNSTSDIRFDLLDDITEMFNVIRKG
jgi:hypothetical protein